MQPDYGLCIEIYERPDLGREGGSSRSTSHLMYKKPSTDEWGSPLWTRRCRSRAGRVKTTEMMQVLDASEWIQQSYQSKVRLGYGPITNGSSQKPGGALEGQAASISLALPGKWLMLTHAMLEDSGNTRTAVSWETHWRPWSRVGSQDGLCQTAHYFLCTLTWRHLEA